MQIHTETKTLEVKMAFSVQHVVLSKKLVAYKVARGPLPDQPILPQLQEKLQMTITEGIATKAALQDYLAGRAKDIKRSKVELAHPELREALRTQGFSAGLEAVGKRSGAVSATPFTDLTTAGASIDNLVQLDYADNMAFDAEGNVLPVAVYFDYIQAHMNDGHYHLEKAAEILQADSRIRFITERRGYSKGASTVIHDVPYYNARRGSSQYLHFWYMPTSEEAKRMWEQQQAYGQKYPTTLAHKAIFDLDLLGLRAGGAAKYDVFEKSDEYELSDDDE